ncbi:MAG: SsrA-binding protein SmpB [Gemmataceae bacterium]
MAKAKAKSKTKDKDEHEIVNVCRNRRATHDYEITDRVECGIVLVGTEVKSLRLGHAQLDEAYAKIEEGEVWLVGCEIPEYPFGNRLNHTPKRQRKLLLHRREIGKFAGEASHKGFTLVPLRIYFKDGRAKVELGVGRGKQSYDKRQSLKTSEAKRDIDRALAARRRR